MNPHLKDEVRAHWESETAGVRYGDSDEESAFYQEVRDQRYQLEPYIPEFAGFDQYSGQSVLEVGVGGGVDFSKFVLGGARATGVDLTEAGLEHTRAQLKLVGADPDAYDLSRSDAEELPFPDQNFELVYSWGVLHHTPDTRTAFSEALRVLKPGGTMKAMVYHSPSWTGWMLWGVYGLMRGRPWKTPRRCVYEHLESPGTKAYGVREFRRFRIYEHQDHYTIEPCRPAHNQAKRTSSVLCCPPGMEALPQTGHSATGRQVWPVPVGGGETDDG